MTMFRILFALTVFYVPHSVMWADESGDGPAVPVGRANSDFAIDLYQQLATENGGENLFFSPYSIFSALTMTIEGARGETAEEIGQVLRYERARRRVDDDAQWIPWETSQIHAAMASLNLRLSKNQIHVANALWGEETYPFRQEFIDTLDKYYDTGGLFPVDFRRNYEAARVRINGWIEDQTNERIRDLIPNGVLDHRTSLVLTNAIYFKGEWAKPFAAELTSVEDFTRSDGGKVKTRLMTQLSHNAARYAAFNADGSFFDSPIMISYGQKEGLYPDADGFAMLELPYRGGELSMVIIAPNKPNGMAKLEAQLTSENLSGWIGRLQDRMTDVYLPKFKLESKYTLGGGEPDTLPQMGMVRAFVDPRDTKRGAQFDGMCDSTDPGNRLCISKVLHNGLLEINEKGTEAAAATAVITFVPVRAPTTVPFVPTFRADRPFVFLIRDKVTGSILFLGRMMDASRATAS